MDTFNAEYSAEVDMSIIASSIVYQGTGVYIHNRNARARLQKSQHYELPPKVIEFINVISPKVYKLSANALEIFTPRACITRNLWLRYIELDNTIDLLTINLADWVAFMSEKSNHRNSYIFYINCNPLSVQYGNIILVQDSSISVIIKITHKSIDTFIQDLCEWIEFPAAEVTLAHIEQRMNSAYRMYKTFREILSSDTTPDSDIKHIWMEISVHASDTEASSFPHYIWWD